MPLPKILGLYVSIDNQLLTAGEVVVSLLPTQAAVIVISG